MLRLISVDEEGHTWWLAWFVVSDYFNDEYILAGWYIVLCKCFFRYCKCHFSDECIGKLVYSFMQVFFF